MSSKPRFVDLGDEGGELLLETHRRDRNLHFLEALQRHSSLGNAFCASIHISLCVV